MPEPRQDVLLRSWVFLRPDRWGYVLAVLCAPAAALLSVVQPLLLREAIDGPIASNDPAGLQRVALWYLAAVVGSFVFQAGYTVIISYTSLRTITRLRRTVYAHALGLSQRVFDREPAGRLMTRVTSDVEALGETLTAGAVTIVVDVVLVIGIITAMFIAEWRLTLLILLFAPVLAVFVEAVRRVLRRLFAEVQTALAELNAFTAERLGGLEVLQLYRAEAQTLERYGVLLDRYRDGAVRTNVWDALLYAVMDATRSVVMAVLLWYGAAWLPEGALTAGLLAAFLDYVARLFNPIQEFSAKVAILQRASSALEKIFSLLDLDDRITPGQPVAAPLESLRLRGASFAYGDGPDVLRSVDLDVPPGQVLAVVGRTGSGKSTLGRVLMRQYDGYRGSVTLGGYELRDLDPSVVRRAVGTVRQDTQLFPGDVRFNLTLGHPVDDARVLEVVERAQATSVVRRLGGLDGVIEHKGNNLSVGEAQLLAFARTLLYDPKIVVLDEATASIDSLTEERLQRATEALLAGRTVVVIAHRLSTIAGADQILVLEAGQVVERGTHASLLAADGRYAAMVREGAVVESDG
jgi:ATP-binding cassette subfamily B protein